MPNRFASGKYAIAQCDRCNFRFKLKELRTQTLKTKPYKVKVCRSCWDPDHPQLQLGMYPVNDPQAVREPRPDNSYILSGNSGLLVNEFSNAPTPLAVGSPEGGSRIIQWGWNPVGGSQANTAGLTPNVLALGITLGTVTVATT
jgi:hypothetical protein